MAGSDTTASTGGGAFPQTVWSVVVRAREPDPERRRQALEWLASAYWKPVYSHIRLGWKKSAEDARDFTQQFFLSVIIEGDLIQRYEPQRGRFRSFLKAALTNFMRDATKEGSRLKRGGHLVRLPFTIDDADVPGLVVDPVSSKPDQYFDRAWRSVVIERAIARVEARLESAEPAALEVFRRYDLASDSSQTSYETVASELGLSPGVVKHHLQRAREEFRRAVVETVAETVECAGDLDEEIRELLE